MPKHAAPPEEATGGARLLAFMERNGLQTLAELAQVFRVVPTTLSRWAKDAETKPLEEALPGPAVILFELLEAGTTTPDLVAMRELAAIHARPGELGEIKGEGGWTVEVSTKSRLGARITTPTGHFIVVHSRWIKDRIARLEELEASADAASRRRLRALSSRYRDILHRIAELPR